MSLRSFFLLTCLAGLLFAACKGPSDRKTTQADMILERPPFAALTDSLRQAQKPTLPGLYFRRAELLSRNNLHELAVSDYRKAWQLAPEETTGLRYASTLTITGQINEAIRLLDTCRKKFPANASFSNMLGDIYQQSGRGREAIQLYDMMLQKDSLDFEAWYEKGLLLEKTSDTAGALAALKRAYDIQPVATYALELAHLYAENRNPAALALCDEVLHKDASHELLDPLFIKGIYYSNAGLYKKAIAQFDSCVRRDWKFTDAYLEKGIAFYKQKNYEEAMNAFQLCIKVSNTYPDGYYWIGRCYEATGGKDEAIVYYQQALALDKDFTEAGDGIQRLKK